MLGTFFLTMPSIIWMRRRELLATVKDATGEIVDLGLSVKWASGNIVKDGTKYSIGAPTDRGCYFSWGNVEGHNEGEGYSFDSTTYMGTPGYSLRGNISTTSGYDAARTTLGGNWRLPTKTEIAELYSNTYWEWVSNYNGTGVKGSKFKKQSDPSVYIFFPACGTYRGTSIDNGDFNGRYWSSTYFGMDDANNLWFDIGSYYREGYSARFLGLSVRAVQ